MPISLGPNSLSKIALGDDEVQNISAADSLIWSAFTPFTEENVNRTNQPVPANTAGCWVEGTGGGAAGLRGVGSHTAVGRGGPGGGAKFDRYFIPRSKLGSTYSVTRGLGGAAAGAAGGDTVFSSGSISLLASGGAPGSGVAAGAGGTCTVVGLNGVSTHEGGHGGSGTSSTGNSGTPGSGEAGAGGGAGGTGLTGAGGAGGDSTTRTGGAGGTGGSSTGHPGISPADSPDGLGGAGGGGGGVGVVVFGAGRGGAGGAGAEVGAAGGTGGNGNDNGGSGGAFGPGGNGRITVEWVAEAPEIVSPSLSLVQASDTSLTVVASGFPDDIDTVTGYNFYLGGAKDNATAQLEATYTFTGLDPATEYTVTAKALNSTGVESAPYQSVTVTTPGDPLLSLEDQMAVDTIVAQAKARGHQRGISIYISGPRGQYAKAYGSAGPRALGLDDHFRMQSITKSFMSTAALMQVDAGNLTLNDTLSQYVTGVPNGNIITIEQMMTMRSGIAHDQDNTTKLLQVALFPGSAWNVAQDLAYIRSAAPRFTPGTQFDYTNSNYILLGYVLEAITGRIIRDILLEDIIEPLGLTETSWPTGSSLPAPFTHGWAPGPLGLIADRDFTVFSPGLSGASGALVTTIGDLHKWGEELRDGTLLSPESHELRKTHFHETPYSGAAAFPFGIGQGPATFGYGLGFEQIGSWFGHDGSFPGFSTALMFEPSTGSVIAVMENEQTVAPVLAALVDQWYRIADYLYPGSPKLPNYMKDVSVSPKAIPSSQKFSTLRMFAGADRGDEDGTVGLPHKVPYTL